MIIIARLITIYLLCLLLGFIFVLAGIFDKAPQPDTQPTQSTQLVYETPSPIIDI